MSDELQELQEGAEHAHQNPTMAPVSLTMAVLAVLVAFATLLGHRAHTKEVMTQAEMHDQWAFYQAKNIRQHEDELFLAANNAGVASDVREKISQETKRYEKEKGEVRDEETKLQSKVDAWEYKADHYDFAEVFLEIGLVVTSITMLSGRRLFWYMGIAMSVVGLVAAVLGKLQQV